MTYAVSTFILVLIGLGLWKRRQPRLHVPLMLTAFALDVALVLYIELSRHAVETAVEAARTPHANDLLLFHVAVSLAVVLLYVVLAITGYSVLKGRRQKLKLHRNLGGAFVLLRLVNYVTSFMV
jgi:uncharacterized membrane protein YozB (DUF420 family)